MSFVTLHNCLDNARRTFPKIDQVVVTEKKHGKKMTIGEVAKTYKGANGIEWYVEHDQFIFTGTRTMRDKHFKISSSYLKTLSEDELVDFYLATIVQWGFWVYRELFDKISPLVSESVSQKLKTKLHLDRIESEQKRMRELDEQMFGSIVGA